MKVTLGYETSESGTKRVLARSDGKVFAPEHGVWSAPRGTVTHEHGRPEFRTWSDVPACWVGCVPYWPGKAVTP